MLLNTLNLFFVAYTALLFIRIVGSWLPQFREHRIMQFVYQYTEPYLGLFRKIIPPIGGVLDLSPLLGFFVLKLIQRFLFSVLQ